LFTSKRVPLPRTSGKGGKVRKVIPDLQSCRVDFEARRSNLAATKRLPVCRVFLPMARQTQLGAGALLRLELLFLCLRRGGRGEGRM
jgi:hypothetical protein